MQVLNLVAGVITHLEVDWRLEGLVRGHARRYSNTQVYVSYAVTQQGCGYTIVIIGI